MPTTFTSALSLYWRMTRPAFLLLTLGACALGVAVVAASGQPVHWPTAVLSTCLACMAHAGANVLNDYCDARNGADAANPGRLYPFTGGAQLIQGGEVSEAATAHWAWWLLAATVLGGLALVGWRGAWSVVGIGLVGVVLAWAYSAPPLQLMSRGLGEVAVGLAWGLVVVGAAAVQLPHTLARAAVLGAGYGLLAANLLLVNGLPDAVGDQRVGKRTLAVRLGGTRAAVLYGLFALACYGGTALAVSAGWLPPQAGWVWVGAPCSALACGWMLRHAHQPQGLRPAIICTIASALLFGLGGSVALALG